MNCGAAVTGRYCSACGQKADVSIPSLGRFLSDAFGDLSSFDSRFWRSLLTLAFKPGRLTRYYLQGQREKYMPPFRMYIVTSVVFFLVFSLLRPEPTPDAVPSADANAASPTVPTRALEVDLTANQRGDEQRPDISFNGDEVNCDVESIDRDLPALLRDRLENACRNAEADGGRAFARAYAENIPVTMLVFIPFVAAIMKLLFLFARRKYVEHLVFFFHVHTFFFVTLTATFLMARAAAALPWLGIPAAIFGWTAWLYFLAYLYLAMRHVYEQGYVLTAVKYVVLGVSYLTAFLVAVAGLFVAVLITR
jgi:hypothetical protein